MFDHAHTRSRRTDDRPITLRKGVHKIECNRPRFVFKAVVEERLSAAGLFGGKEQLHAQALQEMSHILERSGVELVTKTGDE